MDDVDDPNLMAKLRIGEWVHDTEQGQTLKRYRASFSYSLDHDGSMDGGWQVRVIARIPDEQDAMLYDITYGWHTSFLVYNIIIWKA